MLTAPVTGTDGVIYIASTAEGGLHSSLLAIEATGKVRWVSRMQGSRVAGIALGPDGALYVSIGSDKRTQSALHAFDNRGSKEWSLPLPRGMVTSPSLASDGTLYVGDAHVVQSSNSGAESREGGLTAVDKRGRKKWRLPIGAIAAAPTIDDKETVYVPTAQADGTHSILHAVSSDGRQRWSVRFADQLSSAAIDSVGRLYIQQVRMGVKRPASNVSRLLSISSSDGTKVWELDLPEATSFPVWDTSPAIGADGVLFVPGGDYRLYAIGSS